MAFISGKPGFFILIWLACLFIPTAQATAGEKIVLASIPWGKETALQSRYAPLVELLSRKLGRQVELDIANTYEEIGERLHHRAADLGILGPKSYVDAKEKYPQLMYLATCKQPDAYYRSLIITRRDSTAVHELAALRGTSFAYTETGSTSGYLYPWQMLKKAGFDPDNLFARIYFLGHHSKVYDAVAKGAVDAGAVSSTDMEEAMRRNGVQYRILATSEPIPRNAVVASPHLPSSMVAEIREILRGAEQDPTFSHSDSPLKGFLIKDDTFYDIVRQERTLN